ncbi:MAG: tetratricopeptide repeat protein [Bacteroidota bacterium]
MPLLRILCILLLCLSIHAVIGQDEPLQQAFDELKQAKQIRDRSKMASAHLRLGLVYEGRFDNLLAYEHLHQSLAFTDSATVPIRKWTFLRQALGDVAFRLGKYPEAMSHYQSVHSLYREYGDCKSLASNLQRIGSVYNNQGQYDQAIVYYEQAVESHQLAIEDPDIVTDSKGFPVLLMGIGIAHTKQSNYEEAIRYFEQVEQLYSEFPSPEDVKNLQYVYINLGGTYTSMLNFPKAIEYLQRATDISEEYGPKRLVSASYNSIGRVYLNQNAPERSIPYFEKGREIAEELQDIDQLARLNFNLGNAYDELEDTVKAMIEFQSGLKRWQAGQNLSGVAACHLHIARIQLPQGQYDLAQAHLFTARELNHRVGDVRASAQTLITLGQMANKTRRYQAAKKYCLEAYAMVKEDEYYQEIEGSCECLIVAYEALGEYRKMAQYQTTYITAKDSLFNKEKIEEFTRLEMQYDFDKEKEILALEQAQVENRLQADLTQQQLLRNYLIGGLLVGGLVILLLWRAYRLNQQKNQTLAQQKQLIQTSLEEKETLLREIHHRVKNNLQVVSSLLSIQSRTIDDPIALDAIEEGRNRVKAMALIHQNLYQEDNLIGVDLQAYIQKLTDSLLSSYKVDAQQIDIVRAIDPISMDVDTIIPLGLILNELISNALKYAFPMQKEGEIEVKIEQKETGIEVVVQDNGVGLPKNFQMEQSQSMGFKLVQSFVKKMHAQFRVDSDMGTRIHIVLPEVG